MIRLEQVRGEMLERFERVDRRFAQHEQRTGRIDLRLAEIAEQIDALRQEILEQLELLATISGAVFVDGTDDDRPQAGETAAPATPT